MFKGKAECEGQAEGLNFSFFRMNFISTSSSIHLAKMEFLENKHHMQAFLSLAETKLKSWIIKYGRQESVELMLHNYVVSSGFLSRCTWSAKMQTLKVNMCGKCTSHRNLEFIPFMKCPLVLLLNMQYDVLVLTVTSHSLSSLTSVFISHLWRSNTSLKITSHSSSP